VAPPAGHGGCGCLTAGALSVFGGAVVAPAIERPTWGEGRVANELRKVAQEGVIRTAAQIAALEKAKADRCTRPGEIGALLPREGVVLVAPDDVARGARSR